MRWDGDGDILVILYEKDPAPTTDADRASESHWKGVGSDGRCSM